MTPKITVGTIFRMGLVGASVAFLAIAVGTLIDLLFPPADKSRDMAMEALQMVLQLGFMSMVYAATVGFTVDLLDPNMQAGPMYFVVLFFTQKNMYSKLARTIGRLRVGIIEMWSPGEALRSDHESDMAM